MRVTVSAKTLPLRLVEPVEDSKAVAAYEPLLLSTQHMLDVYWAQAVPLLERCIGEAMHGELTVEDLYEGIKAGQMFGIVVKNDEGELPDVALALVMELIFYPRMPVMNVVALGGRDLEQFSNKFWKYVCGWSHLSGVRYMQASASPGMARMLKKLGFNSVYTTMRMDLKEM